LRLRVSLDIVSVRTEQDTVVAVSGYVQWENVSEFREGLAAHLDTDSRVFLVDLTGLVSWAPPGQAVLVGCSKRVRRDGRWLAVYGLAEVPRLQLQGSTLAAALTVFPSLETARAAAPVAHA
jgi:anti-anti-sigma regulatory factor